MARLDLANCSIIFSSGKPTFRFCKTLKYISDLLGGAARAARHGGQDLPGGGDHHAQSGQYLMSVSDVCLSFHFTTFLSKSFLTSVHFCHFKLKFIVKLININIKVLFIYVLLSRRKTKLEKINAETDFLF